MTCSHYSSTGWIVVLKPMKLLSRHVQKWPVNSDTSDTTATGTQTQQLPEGSLFYTLSKNDSSIPLQVKFQLISLWIKCVPVQKTPPYQPPTCWTLDHAMHPSNSQPTVEWSAPLHKWTVAVSIKGVSQIKPAKGPVWVSPPGALALPGPCINPSSVCLTFWPAIVEQ